jgi:small subunit ribosomal protein S27Ae
MKHSPVKQSKFYSVKDGKLERKGKTCDRCGDGIYMADHKDRWYCGKCRMTVWKKKNE